MKIHALMMAVALASGSALAAGTVDASAQPTQKKAAQKVAKKTATTQAMGAGPASPLTDLQAASRQARIDQAYANWQSLQR